MTRSRFTAITLTALALVCSVGCTSTPQRGDPAYAPSLPPVPPPRERANGSIYQAGHELAFFEDLRARRVGDILTVVLAESTDAQKSATTSASRDTEVEVAAPVLFGDGVTINGKPILRSRLQADSAFDGDGDSAQSNQLEGSITVSVADVLANGYLVVQGEKWIGINNGDEYLRLRGIVRPSDIRPDNTVLSTQLANTKVVYGGTGSLADVNRQGWLSRFFTSALWPF